eukprot:12698220-Heterocapsa_arctica.AAC.1
MRERMRMIGSTLHVQCFINPAAIGTVAQIIEKLSMSIHMPAGTEAKLSVIAEQHHQLLEQCNPLI